jgi:hypothetical protein
VRRPLRASLGASPMSTTVQEHALDSLHILSTELVRPVFVGINLSVVTKPNANIRVRARRCDPLVIQLD